MIKYEKLIPEKLSKQHYVKCSMLLFFFFLTSHGTDVSLPLANNLLPVSFLLNHNARRPPGAVIKDTHSAYKTTFLIYHRLLGFMVDLIAEFTEACSVRNCVSLQFN